MHILFQIDAADYPQVSPHIKLQVLGRSAIINNEVIDMSSKTEKQRKKEEPKVFYKSFSVKIGKKNVKFSFIHKLILIRNSKDNHFNVEDLKNIGIIDTEYNEKTTYFISEPSNHSNTILDALISQVPIIPYTYIQEILNNKEKLVENFEENFPKVEDFAFDPSYLPNSLRKTMFDKIVFIFGESKQYRNISGCLESAKAKTCLYEFTNSSTVEGLTQYIKNETPSNYKFVLVKIQTPENDNFLTSVYNPDGKEYQNLKLMNEAAKKLGVYLATNEDIFNAVIGIDPTPLFKTRTQKLTSPLPIDISEQPPLKKVRRGRFKAMDSLDFFAGGGKVELQEPKNEISQQIPNTQINDSNTQLSDSTQASEEGPPKKKRRSKFKAVDNMMLSLDYSLPEENESETQIKVSSTDVSRTQDSVKESIQIPEESIQVPDSPISKESVVNDSEAPEEQVLETQESSSNVIKKETQSFSSAVLQAKKMSDARTKKDLGLEEEFSDIGIDQLRNLAIIETIEIKPRQRQEVSSSQSPSKNPKWSNRKNFKVFVKNSTISNNNKSFNHSFREYVTFKQFIPIQDDDKVSKRSEEMLQHIERQKRLERANNYDNENTEESFSFRNDSITTFNNDNDKQEMQINKQKPQALFVESDEEQEFDENLFTDNDDDDKNSKYEAQANDVPEFRRNFTNDLDSVPKSKAKSKAKTQSKVKVQPKKQVQRFQQDEDEDDDDDDVPRFRFRS